MDVFDFQKYCTKVLFIYIIEFFGASLRFWCPRRVCYSSHLPHPVPTFGSCPLGWEESPRASFRSPLCISPHPLWGPEFALSIILWGEKDYMRWNSSLLSNQETTTVKYSLERKHEVNGSSEAWLMLGRQKTMTHRPTACFCRKSFIGTHTCSFVFVLSVAALGPQWQSWVMQQKSYDLQSWKYLGSSLMWTSDLDYQSTQMFLDQYVWLTTV